MLPGLSSMGNIEVTSTRSSCSGRSWTVTFADAVGELPETLSVDGKALTIGGEKVAKNVSYFALQAHAYVQKTGGILERPISSNIFVPRREFTDSLPATHVIGVGLGGTVATALRVEGVGATCGSVNNSYCEMLLDATLPPRVASISPTSGAAGTEITITGTNLTGPPSTACATGKVVVVVVGDAPCAVDTGTVREIAR